MEPSRRFHILKQSVEVPKKISPIKKDSWDPEKVSPLQNKAVGTLEKVSILKKITCVHPKDFTFFKKMQLGPSRKFHLKKVVGVFEKFHILKKPVEDLNTVSP